MEEKIEKTNLDKAGGAKSLLTLMAFVFMFIKSSLMPFARTAKFVKNDILGSAKHDAKIVAAISFMMILSFVLGVILWITLGAGLAVWAIAGTGPALLAWAYIVAFELATLIILGLSMALLKNKLKTPESLERAEELLKLK